jgi:hypothetical protein
MAVNYISWDILGNNRHNYNNATSNSNNNMLCDRWQLSRSDLVGWMSWVITETGDTITSDKDIPECGGQG